MVSMFSGDLYFQIKPFSNITTFRPAVVPAYPQLLCNSATKLWLKLILRGKRLTSIFCIGLSAAILFFVEFYYFFFRKPLTPSETDNAFLAPNLHLGSSTVEHLILLRLLGNGVEGFGPISCFSLLVFYLY